MRPVLVAERNPYSRLPEHALAPDPAQSSGARLYGLLASRIQVSPAQYMRAFERRNFFDEELSPEEFVHSIPKGTVVVLLGERVREALYPALCLPKIFMYPVACRERVWRQVPHPSGRCRFYNDPIARELVALLLAELYGTSHGRMYAVA